MISRSIAEKLVGDIMSGRYTKTGKLPSEAELSRAFGVSRMTLRAALEELRRQRLIEKRNGVGSFLTMRAMRKSGIIGLIIPDYGEYAFFNVIEKEVRLHASRLGYRVSLVSTREHGRDALARDLRRKARKLAVSRAEGVIFRPLVDEKFAESNHEVVNILGNAKIPTVLIDSDITRPPQRSDYDLITVGNIGAGRKIAEHLHARGYKRIAFLMGENPLMANSNWSDRLFGLAGELALLGQREGVRQLGFPPEDESRLQKLLKSGRRPDAIVCGNDEQALKLLDSLKRLGVKVPDKVAVVGFDDISGAHAACPPLTTVSQPVRLLAATAFKSLLARIRYPASATREIRLDAPLVIRGTT